MVDQNAQPRRYAILIGINAYPNNSDSGYPAAPELKGCVNDVEKITEALKTSVRNVTIYTFTATTNPDRKPSQPACVEPRERWPTHSNISSCLDRVFHQGKPGDHVYIHYSGHSTVVPGPNKDPGDLALALLEGQTASEMVYFHGKELAERLRDMVDKGLGVTMVLDCCSSGGVPRNDDAVRYVSYCPEIEQKYSPRDPEDPSPGKKGRLETGNQDNSGGLRRASMRPNWLANPYGYAILASGDAREAAYEVRFPEPEDGPRHGTLTYFLLDTFAMLGGVGGSMQHLYDSIEVKVRNHRRLHVHKTQTPLLLGNGKQLFFGCNRLGCVGDIPITETIEGNTDGRQTRLRLHAGKAHGISQGDRFTLRPLGVSSPVSEFPVTAEAYDVRGVTSYLEVVGETVNSLPVETGWLATATTRLALRRFPIRLEVFENRLAEWREAMQQRVSLMELDGGAQKPASFSIVQTNDATYDICDESRQTLTTVVEDSEMTIQKILGQIQHLASFKLVRDRVNKESRSQFRGSFSVHLVKKNGAENSLLEPGCLKTGDLYDACLHPECVRTVTGRDEVRLRMENKAVEDDAPKVYLYVFGLSSEWEIEGLPMASRVVVQPRSRDEYGTVEERKITFSVGEGQEKCEDVIKVFVTAQPSSFSMLELPKLGQAAHWAQPQMAGERGGRASEDWAALTFRVQFVP